MHSLRNLAVVIVVLLSPIVATADQIRVDYTGMVTLVEGDGLGYAVGDVISGWFEFDTDDFTYFAEFPTGTGDIDFGTGPIASSLGDDLYDNPSEVTSRQRDSYCLPPPDPPLSCAGQEMWISDGSQFSESIFTYSADGELVSVESTNLELIMSIYLFDSSEGFSQGFFPTWDASHYDEALLSLLDTSYGFINDQRRSYVYSYETGETTYTYDIFNYVEFRLTDVHSRALPEPITIDIKPGSDPNSVNPTSKQKISVAVLTTDTFDALQTDFGTIEFGPNGATESHGRAHVEDVGRDGDMDLLLHFNTQETGIACGDTLATLTGETFSGVAVIGTDPIVTTNCD